MKPRAWEAPETSCGGRQRQWISNQRPWCAKTKEERAERQGTARGVPKRRDSGSVAPRYSPAGNPLRAITSVYQRALSFGVRSSVSKSTCTIPKRGR
jgi:hypothetical protein